MIVQYVRHAFNNMRGAHRSRRVPAFWRSLQNDNMKFLDLARILVDVCRITETKQK